MDGTSEKLVIKGSLWSRKPMQAFSSISILIQIEKNKQKEKLKTKEKEENSYFLISNAITITRDKTSDNDHLTPFGTSMY